VKSGARMADNPPWQAVMLPGGVQETGIRADWMGLSGTYLRKRGFRSIGYLLPVYCGIKMPPAHFSKFSNDNLPEENTSVVAYKPPLPQLSRLLHDGDS